MYKLVNAYEMHKKHPETFEIPTNKEINESEYLKVIFTDENGMNGEWMWIRVTKRHGDKITGVLDNIPDSEKGIKLGDIIKFERKHVIQTMK